MTYLQILTRIFLSSACQRIPVLQSRSSVTVESVFWSAPLRWTYFIAMNLRNSLLPLMKQKSLF